MINGGELQVLEQSLGLQVKQAQALHELIVKFNEQEERIDGKIERIEDLMEHLSKQITINYEEQNEIRSIVSKKAITFARKHLGDTAHDLMIQAWYGVFISRIYKRLKEYFNVVRYTALRKEDYEDAVNYLLGIEYDHLTENDLKKTAKIVATEALLGETQ